MFEKGTLLSPSRCESLSNDKIALTKSIYLNPMNIEWTYIKGSDVKIEDMSQRRRNELLANATQGEKCYSEDMSQAET